MAMDKHRRDLKLSLKSFSGRSRNTQGTRCEANRYAFGINICSIHDGTLLRMHPPSHSYTHINKYVSAVSIPCSILPSFSLFGFPPLLYDTAAAFTSHCDLPVDAECCRLWIPNIESMQRSAVIFIHDEVIDFATTFIAVQDKAICGNMKFLEASPVIFEKILILRNAVSYNPLKKEVKKKLSLNARYIYIMRCQFMNQIGTLSRY